MNLQEWLTLGGAISVTIGGVWKGIVYLIDKGLIHKDTFKFSFFNKSKPEINTRVLTPEQLSKLRNHPLFNDVNLALHHNLELIYRDSKQKLPQLLFAAHLQYILVVHYEDCLDALKRVEKNMDASKNLVIKTLIGTVLLSRDNANKLIKEKNIKEEISDKFSHWYDEHFSWYLESAELQTLDAEDYYDELYTFLNLTRTFIKALLSSAKRHIDSFNGEITSMLDANEIKDIDFGEFEKYFKTCKI